jgi:hypothetical protein
MDKAHNYEDAAYGFSGKKVRRRKSVPKWVGGYPLQIVCPQGVTYVIEAPEVGVVKIGRTKNLAKRYAELSTSSPEILRVSRVIKGEWHESVLHRNLKQFRGKGEWFVFSDEVRDYLNRYWRGDTYFQPI